MHHRRHKDSLAFNGIDHTIGIPLEKIPSEAPLQTTPDGRMLLNLVEGRFNRMQEFLPQSLTTLFIERCGLTDFLFGRKIEANSQRSSSLRISRNAFVADTVFVPFRFHAAKRFSASATHASSTAVRGSPVISTSKRSANRSRSVAGRVRACFPKLMHVRSSAASVSHAFICRRNSTRFSLIHATSKATGVTRPIASQLIPTQASGSFSAHQPHIHHTTILP